MLAKLKNHALCGGTARLLLAFERTHTRLEFRLAEVTKCNVIEAACRQLHNYC